MSSRQHEPVTVEPVRVLGVVPHDLIVQNMTHWSTAHGQTGVTRIGLLYSINGQESDRVDRLLDQRGLCGLVQSLDGGGPDRPVRAYTAALEPRELG